MQNETGSKVVQKWFKGGSNSLLERCLNQVGTRTQAGIMYIQCMYNVCTKWPVVPD
jgi:hypothetical protein